MTTSKGLGISIKYGDHSREMELRVTSMLSASACYRAITCAWHCCGSNRVCRQYSRSFLFGIIGRET
jgi:hypothetical protein